MERPVLTVRLKDAAAGQQGDLPARAPRSRRGTASRIAAGAAGAATRRDIMLNDVRIEDGTVRIVYDEKAPSGASSISTPI